MLVLYNTWPGAEPVQQIVSHSCHGVHANPLGCRSCSVSAADEVGMLAGEAAAHRPRYQIASQADIKRAIV